MGRLVCCGCLGTFLKFFRNATIGFCCCMLMWLWFLVTCSRILLGTHLYVTAVCQSQVQMWSINFFYTYVWAKGEQHLVRELNNLLCKCHYSAWKAFNMLAEMQNSLVLHFISSPWNILLAFGGLLAGVPRLCLIAISCLIQGIHNLVMHPNPERKYWFALLCQYWESYAYSNW